MAVRPQDSGSGVGWRGSGAMVKVGQQGGGMGWGGWVTPPHSGSRNFAYLELVNLEELLYKV